jgi:hypothetical protein
MFFSTSSVALALLAASQLVAGHGAIVKAVGDAGGAGSAIGSKLCPQTYHRAKH